MPKRRQNVSISSSNEGGGVQHQREDEDEEEQEFVVKKIHCIRQNCQFNQEESKRQPNPDKKRVVYFFVEWDGKSNANGIIISMNLVLFLLQELNCKDVR